MPSIFERVKSALDEADIEGLLGLGALTDEYEHEASLIKSEVAGRSSKLGRLNLAEPEMEQIIAKVWNAQFGPFDAKAMEMRKAAFRKVARAILESSGE